MEESGGFLVFCVWGLLFFVVFVGWFCVFFLPRNSILYTYEASKMTRIIM